MNIPSAGRSWITARRTRIGAVGASAALLAAGIPLGMAQSASPDRGTDAEKRGGCSAGNTRYDFEVDRDDGRYEINFEVDSNVRGQQWRVRLFESGNRYYSRVLTTDREGEVEAERDRSFSPGPDAFRARAVNLGNGVVCKARIVRN